MKKSILFLPILLICGALSAQQISIDPSGQATALPKMDAPLPALTQNPVSEKTTKTCSDKNKYCDSKTGTNRGSVVMSNTPNGLFGTFQAFPDFSGTVTGVYMDIYSKHVANNVNVSIYSIDPFSGLPDINLGGGSINIPVGSTPTERGGTFPSPITVNNGFYIAVELNVLSVDSVTVLFNQNGNGNGLDFSYVRGSSGYLSLLYTFNFDVDIMVRPLLQFNMSQNISGGASTVCPGEGLYFSASSPQPFVYSPIYSKNGALYTWNFGDGTPPTNSPSFPHIFQPLSDPNKDYLVKVTTNFWGYTTNCKVSDSMIVEQGNIPDAFFSYTSQKLNVTFNNKSKFGSAYLWEFGTGATSNLQSPLYSYPAPGTYTVSLTVTNPCSTDVYQSFVQVSDTADFNNGVAAVTPVTKGFTVQPNPVQQTLFVNPLFAEQVKAEVKVFDMTGRQVHHESVMMNGAQPIDVSDLQSGTYFIQVETANHVSTKKFVKQ